MYPTENYLEFIIYININVGNAKEYFVVIVVV